MKENTPNNNTPKVTASAARQEMHEQMKNAQAAIITAVRQSDSKPK